MYLAKRWKVGGGVASADAFCVSNAPDNTSSWKALIVSDAGCKAKNISVPCRRASAVPNLGDGQMDWILKPAAAYYLMDNTTLLFETTSAALIAWPFKAKLVRMHWCS